MLEELDSRRLVGQVLDSLIVCNIDGRCWSSLMVGDWEAGVLLGSAG